MSDSKLAKTSVLIIAFGLISKFMALVRQSSIGAIYGQSGNTDAYMVAMKIIIISTTILGVILNTTLIPLLTEIQNEEDKKKSDIFFNSVLNWVLLISFFTGFIIYFFAPQLVKMSSSPSWPTRPPETCAPRRSKSPRRWRSPAAAVWRSRGPSSCRS